MRLRTIGMMCSLCMWAACAGGELTSSPPGGGQAGKTPAPQVHPLWGGTLLVDPGGRLAAVSDPDHDRVWVVDLPHRQVLGSVPLAAGSAPFRLSEDGSGHLGVVLRGSGQLATIDLHSRVLLSTTAVCPEPRGATFDPAHEATQVACEGGELVTVAADGTTHTAHPAPDLRDVIPVGSQLWASTWRSANLLAVAADGTVSTPLAPPSFGLPAQASFVPHTAWRTLPTPSGDVVMVHQRAIDGPVTSIQLANPVPAYYSNACSSPVVRSAITLVHGGQVVASVESPANSAIDAAVSPDGKRVSLASPIQNAVYTQAVPNPGETSAGTCATPGTAQPHQVAGQPVAVAYAPDGTLVVQEREPFQLEVFPPTDSGVPQATPAFAVAIANYTQEHTAETGFALFHTATSGGIACMSCHPEAGDDGNVWTLAEGKVRTQSLKGGLSHTAPFHWAGDLADIDALLAETFVHRMGGAMPGADQERSLSSWLDSVPASRPSVAADDAQVLAGKHVFDDAGCGACHSGDPLTDNLTVDVGTGGRFQVPSLRGVASHGPWMHDGCAHTLEDRFGTCGGTNHGSTRGLAPADLASLIAYLRSL